MTSAFTPCFARMMSSVRRNHSGSVKANVVHRGLWVIKRPPCPNYVPSDLSEKKSHGISQNERHLQRPMSYQASPVPQLRHFRSRAQGTGAEWTCPPLPKKMLCTPLIQKYTVYYYIKMILRKSHRMLIGWITLMVERNEAPQGPILKCFYWCENRLETLGKQRFSRCSPQAPAPFGGIRNYRPFLRSNYRILPNLRVRHLFFQASQRCASIEVREEIGECAPVFSCLHEVHAKPCVHAFIILRSRKVWVPWRGRLHLAKLLDGPRASHGANLLDFFVFISIYCKVSNSTVHSVRVHRKVISTDIESISLIASIDDWWSIEIHVRIWEKMNPANARADFSLRRQHFKGAPQSGASHRVESARQAERFRNAGKSSSNQSKSRFFWFSAHHYPNGMPAPFPGAAKKKKKKDKCKII